MAAPLPQQDRAATVARLRQQFVDNGTAPEVRHRGPAGGGDIPLHQLLRPLVPGGSLPRGTIVAVPPRTGSTAVGGGAISYATHALLAGATAGGAWAGIIGYPNFGIAAACGLGADLSKMLMLDEPGERWPDAVTVLAAAVDLVLLHAPGRPNGTQLRRLANRIRQTDRQRGCVLVVTSPWERADLTLSVHSPQWEGLGDGVCNLTRRRVTIRSRTRPPPSSFGAGGVTTSWPGGRWPACVAACRGKRGVSRGQALLDAGDLAAPAAQGH
ncbi:hypothetical protein KGQ19_15990 [Catenulispora sp. NL8]|uniref:Uncharacterized protein n=1 Tax=Catenulispora pinistramenti TaxID=2705254 RepID=A0ABS5KQN5_9ACTN|nr:hypothetical protein [Catenulispora pinistramenti]MBS2548367.1 hypothetical protein [Catenulispora pinistramenti]